MSNALSNIEVTTESGKILKGKLFHSKNAKTVFIAITGVEGNFNNNPFYHNIGQTLVANGIDFVVAQTRDAFNKVKFFNEKTHKTEFYGAWDEDFDDSDEDVQAYVDYAQSLGYEQIILGGQSLGANKVIHYLAEREDALIQKFLLLSPVNIMALRNKVPANQKQMILTEKRHLNDQKILPFKLFGWLRANVATAYRWLSQDTLNNVHPETRADFAQVAKIKQTGALLIGTRDGFTGGNVRNYLTNINNHFARSDANKLIFIPNASHIYRGKEQEVAQEVLTTIEDWQNKDE